MLDFAGSVTPDETEPQRLSTDSLERIRNSPCRSKVFLMDLNNSKQVKLGLLYNGKLSGLYLVLEPN